MIRERTAQDLDECVRALAEVHRADGYPSVWPSDPRRWISALDNAAWVDADTAGVHGHLAVRVGTSITWPTAADPAVWVARFFVEPSHQRRGVGLKLLEKAFDFAHERALSARLEVAASGDEAIALYEDTGWTRDGERLADWVDAAGHHPTVYLYSKTAA